MKLPFHHNARQKKFENARSLKKAQTEAEVLLWTYLRNRNHLGKKFRRQHPIGPYIADFYCHESKLVVEVDGGVHLSCDSLEYDEARTQSLEAMGLRVIRFTNEQVLGDVEFVLDEIRNCI